MRIIIRNYPKVLRREVWRMCDRDMEYFVYDIEEDNQIKVEPEKKEKPQRIQETVDESIQIGSPVKLVSDKSVIGAVIGKDGNRYTVLINGKFESFYEEQIDDLPIKELKKYTHMCDDKVISFLQAHQIKTIGDFRMLTESKANEISVKGKQEIYKNMLIRILKKKNEILAKMVPLE